MSSEEQSRQLINAFIQEHFGYLDTSHPFIAVSFVQIIMEQFQKYLEGGVLVQAEDLIIYLQEALHKEWDSIVDLFGLEDSHPTFEHTLIHTPDVLSTFAKNVLQIESREASIDLDRVKALMHFSNTFIYFLFPLIIKNQSFESFLSIRKRLLRTVFLKILLHYKLDTSLLSKSDEEPISPEEMIGEIVQILTKRNSQ